MRGGYSHVALCGWSAVTLKNIQYCIMDHGRHLENRYDVITPLANGPISTKFGSQMQNDMPMTTQR